MRKTNEEKGLLAKLASGVLDGMVGDERVYRGYKNVYCGKYITVSQYHIDKENQKGFLTAKRTSAVQERGRRNTTIRMRRSSIFSNDMDGLRMTKM